jgi:hypothetical protein
LDNVVAVNPDAHRKLHESQGWQIGVALTSQFTIVDAVTAEDEQDTYDIEIAGEFLSRGRLPPPSPAALLRNRIVMPF